MKGKQRILPGIAKRTAIGVTVSMGTLLVVCTIGATMISAGNLDDASMGYVSAVAILFGGLIGAGTAVRGADSARLLRCVIHGGTLFLILLCIGMILFDTAANGIGTTGLLCIGSSLAAGLFSMKKKGRRTPGKHRYHFH